jgi:hypothetical protein
MTAVTAVRSSGRTVHPVSATRASVALQGTHTVSWIGQIAGAESHARASGDIRHLMLTLSSVMSVQDWAATAGRSRVQRAPVQAAVKYQGSAAPPSRPPRLRTRPKHQRPQQDHIADEIERVAAVKPCRPSLTHVADAT